jgi:hypothetical protein
MLSDNIEYLPVKKTKSNKFSVCMTDKDHCALLVTSHQEGSCRAVTATDLIHEALEIRFQKMGIPFTEEAIKKLMQESGMAKYNRR